MTNRRQFNTGALALLAGQGLGLSQSAYAQDASGWPTRPVRMVAPGLPGAASDTFARALADRLGPVLKQQVLIENKPGANGLLAARTVLQAPADGYNYLYATASATVMVQALKPNMGVDFTRDFVPVAATFFGGVLLAVNPDVPAKDLKELIALIKSKPDGFSYASWGVGSNGHLTMEWLKAQTGMRIQHVPYKGIAPILTEMSEGIIKVGWVDLVSAVPFAKSGKIRLIASNGGMRTPQLPDLPTMSEQGFAYPGTGWQGVLARKGTPDAIVKRMHDEINAILMSPEIAELTVRFNVEPPRTLSLDEFSALLERDLATSKRLVADAKIKIE